MGELYGEINMNTLEWHDGILATHVRRFVSESSATTSDEPVKTSGSADRGRSSKSRDEGMHILLIVVLKSERASSEVSLTTYPP